MPGTEPVPGPTARLAVAAQPLEGDRTPVSVGGDEPFVAASVMKVHILVALLLRVQGEFETPARKVTAEERAWAAAMIERSDNQAANALWQAAGSAEGIAATGRRLGLALTRPARDGRWGLSTTTAADQLALLRAVHGTGPCRDVLAPQFRQWVRKLMGNVIPAQRWGVTAAGDRRQPVPHGLPEVGPDDTYGMDDMDDMHEVYEVKNGWLPRTATGRWVINSVGRVTAGGRPWLIAVLSDGHATADEGITAVEEAARATVRAGAGTLAGTGTIPRSRNAPGPRRVQGPVPAPAPPSGSGPAPVKGFESRA
jgi:hypothetical protein